MAEQQAAVAGGVHLREARKLCGAAVEGASGRGLGRALTPRPAGFLGSIPSF